MTTQRQLRLDLVIRTSKRKKEARSPDQQRDMAEAVCATHHHKIAAVHDSGVDESGKTMDRPTIHEVMRRVRDGETDGVIVALVDRMGRAPIEEAMTTVRELDAIGGVFVPADLGGLPVDLSDPMAETNLVIQFQIARQFWATTAARFRRSQKDAVKAGKLCGKTPLGYVRAKGRLQVDPFYGPVVREAYRRGAQDGLHSAMAYLQEMVPERTWTTDSTRKLLGSRKSRVYLGESRVGDLVNPNAHPPLTDLETYTAAQTEPRSRRPNGHYALSGIATCAECGSGLHGQLQTVKGLTYRRYRCSNKACGGGSSINAETLESYVREILRTALSDWDLVLSLSPEGVEDARVEVDRARDELTAFANVVPATSPAFREGYEIRATALQGAQDRFAGLAGQAARTTTIPAPDQLDDPEEFDRALRLVIASIPVARGRGLVADRVPVEAWGFTSFDSDQVARMLAA